MLSISYWPFVHILWKDVCSSPLPRVIFWKCKPAKNSLIASPCSPNKVQNPQHNLQGPMRPVLSSLPQLHFVLLYPCSLVPSTLPNSSLLSVLWTLFPPPIPGYPLCHSSGLKLNIISSRKTSFPSLPLWCDK